jgi:cation/acetate symporter
VISAVAFATVLAVVAGLAITASASVAHDFYDAVLRGGKSTEAEQVRVSKITVVVIGIASIILGILAMDQNVAFLVSLAFCIAASANLPTILYSLYWKRFNTTGAVSSIYVGLISSLVVLFFSNSVSGTETAMFNTSDWSLLDLTNPAIISIPLGFLAGIVGTYLGKPDNKDALQAEMEVRSLTGVGVEAPVDH